MARYAPGFVARAGAKKNQTNKKLMETTNATIGQITNELVKTFRDDERTAEYNTQSERYELFSGWAGCHTPVSRPAFIAAFGAEIVEKAENEAKRIISEDAKKYATSDYMAHVREAEAHEKAGQPAPEAGRYMFAVSTDWKCDGGRGVFEEIHNRLEYFPEKNFKKQLVFVGKVYHVTAAEFSQPKTADKLAKLEDCPGGWSCEDGDFLDAKKMHWTHAAAVVAPDGRYYLIDNEGYSYARYIFTPLNWRAMFADIIEAKEPQKKAPKEAKKAIKAGGLQLIDYSEKALAVIGDTKAVKEQLKQLGGRFNPRLSCGAGWIFSKKRESELKALIAG